MARGEPGYKSQGGGETVDKGRDAKDDGTVLDDDIKPGCRLLQVDINIAGLKFSKIWRRADYIRIYDYLEMRYKRPGVPPSRPPAVVLTGQPGVGVFSYAPSQSSANRMPSA
jgi:hypothetical protein